MACFFWMRLAAGPIQQECQMAEDRRINPNPLSADQKELLIAKIEKVYTMAVEQNNPDSALRVVELLARINGYA